MVKNKVIYLNHAHLSGYSDEGNAVFLRRISCKAASLAGDTRDACHRGQAVELAALDYLWFGLSILRNRNLPELLLEIWYLISVLSRGPCDAVQVRNIEHYPREGLGSWLLNRPSNPRSGEHDLGGITAFFPLIRAWTRLETLVNWISLRNAGSRGTFRRVVYRCPRVDPWSLVPIP